MAQVPVPIQIGIVEDDASVGRALSRLLRGHGYECTVFRSGEIALDEVIQVHRMDCLIVDIQLGGIDGFELCERLDAGGLAIPHIFISAYAIPDTSAVSDLPTNQILLIKPVDEHELLESIERVLCDHRH